CRYDDGQSSQRCRDDTDSTARGEDLSKEFRSVVEKSRVNLLVRCDHLRTQIALSPERQQHNRAILFRSECHQVFNTGHLASYSAWDLHLSQHAPQSEATTERVGGDCRIRRTVNVTEPNNRAARADDRPCARTMNRDSLASIEEMLSK